MTVTCITMIFHCCPHPRIDHGKKGHFRVNRLESGADYSLLFSANIRKAWKPTSIHTPLLYDVYGSIGTFCEVTTLPVHNGVVREHSDSSES